MSISSASKVLDLLRKPFFWKIQNAKKEGDLSTVWKLFESYSEKYTAYEKSEWHSEVLNLASRLMVDENEWRFAEFFKRWDYKNFLESDWKETSHDGNTYKPLAIKCLKKAFDIVRKRKDTNADIDWLISAYSDAITKITNDEWLLREYAILLIRTRKYDVAVDLYRKLVLDLGEKAYIWHEFSKCLVSMLDVKIGMLFKALELESNDDFLGEIRVELAKSLIDGNHKAIAAYQLEKYKNHREEKGWKLSEGYEVVVKLLEADTYPTEDNPDFSRKYVQAAEEYAYSDIEWTDLLIVDCWKDENGKRRCKLSNGQDIEFTVNQKRFRLLKDLANGSVIQLKLHKVLIEKEGESRPFGFPPQKELLIKYTPLLCRKSNADKWSLFEDEYAVVDYINKDKGVIHAISTEDEEVFFRDNVAKYKTNSFIKYKKLISKRKDEQRIDLYNIRIVEKEQCLTLFPKYIAIVDHINQNKKLFHFTVDRSIHGIVKFSETSIIPVEGKFLEIYIAKKTNKETYKEFYKPIEIYETEQISESLMKIVSGSLRLKFKQGGGTLEYNDLTEDEMSNLEPDFGFIDDYYIPKHVLKSNAILRNCEIKARAIFSRDKWKILEIIERIDSE